MSTSLRPKLTTTQEWMRVARAIIRKEQQREESERLEAHMRGSK